MVRQYDQTERVWQLGIVTTGQENRKPDIGRDHLRVPSGVPRPASGLSAASGLSFESTQRVSTASQRAECSEWSVYQPAG